MTINLGFLYYLSLSVVILCFFKILPLDYLSIGISASLVILSISIILMIVTLAITLFALTKLKNLPKQKRKNPWPYFLLLDSTFLGFLLAVEGEISILSSLLMTAMVLKISHYLLVRKIT